MTAAIQHDYSSLERIITGAVVSLVIAWNQFLMQRLAARQDRHNEAQKQRMSSMAVAVSNTQQEVRQVAAQTNGLTEKLVAAATKIAETKGHDIGLQEGREEHNK